ncbi:MAG: hypothetical protein JWQ43_3858 [Glaciihabitans sp.]|nr:hypothetical protein [Glaciihabitans sp.]
MADEQSADEPLADELQTAASLDPSGWDGFLAEREREIAELVQVDDASAVAEWSPPTDLGVMPAVFADRARRIVAAQTEALLVLAARRIDVSRQLSAVQSVPTVSLAQQPIYLDIAG